jgi:hypothetical protein
LHVPYKYRTLDFGKQSMAHNTMSNAIFTAVQCDGSLPGKDPQTADTKSLHGDEDEHLNDLH